MCMDNMLNVQELTVVDSHDNEEELTKDITKITIYVRRQCFEFPLDTLLATPHTRLWQLAQNVLTANDNTTTQPVTFSFDRDPIIFSFIHEFYISGELHIKNKEICMRSLEREFNFWKIDTDLLFPCCWQLFQDYKLRLNFLREIKQEWVPVWFPQYSPKPNGLADKIHLFLEYPNSATVAKVSQSKP